MATQGNTSFFYNNLALVKDHHQTMENRIRGAQSVITGRRESLSPLLRYISLQGVSDLNKTGRGKYPYFDSKTHHSPQDDAWILEPRNTRLLH